jgi:hypothetical protein
MPEASTTTPAVPRKKDPAIPYSGNEPLFDADHFVSATITLIREKIFHPDTPQEWSAYQWMLEGPGTLRPWPWSELTVKRVQPLDRDGKLNALTEWMVRLGMRQLDTLKREDVTVDELQAALGKTVRFKTYRKDGYYRVDYATLQLAP